MRYSLTLMLVAMSPLMLFGSGGECRGQELQQSLTRLTANPAVDYYPSWSPDGAWIVFSSSRDGGNLWKVPSGGGQAVQVTDFNSNHPRWSPDGSYIAFDSDGGSVVQLVSSGGGIPIRIVPDSITMSRGAHPCWSPDGARIAFAAEGDVWTVDLPSGEVTLIFQMEGYYARPFSWSRDGRYITADVGTTFGKSDDDIWLLSLEDGPPKILTELPGREGNPIYSPDGTMIVFMRDVDGLKTLWMMASTGGEPVRLIEYAGFNANPRFSPDGDRLAFSSDMSGDPEIWVMDLDVVALKAALGITP